MTAPQTADAMHMVLVGAFYVLLVIFTLHTLFLAYHWFTYGDSKKISASALILYIFGGAVLFLTLGTTLIML